MTEPNLRFPAIFCANQQFSARICGFLRLPAPSKCLNFATFHTSAWLRKIIELLNSSLNSNPPPQTPNLPKLTTIVIFFFPYNPPPRPTPTNPRPSHPEKLDFGPFRLHLAPFRLRSVWLRFGSVSGPFRSAGWGGGGVGERGFCKGKEYH